MVRRVKTKSYLQHSLNMYILTGKLKFLNKNNIYPNKKAHFTGINKIKQYMYKVKKRQIIYV